MVQVWRKQAEVSRNQLLETVENGGLLCDGETIRVGFTTGIGDFGSRGPTRLRSRYDDGDEGIRGRMGG